MVEEKDREQEQKRYRKKKKGQESDKEWDETTRTEEPITNERRFEREDTEKGAIERFKRRSQKKKRQEEAFERVLVDCCMSRLKKHRVGR